MKKFLLPIAVFLFVSQFNYAQHFEWAYETPVASKWFTYGEMTTDHLQNSYIIGHTTACTDNSCRAYRLLKYDKDGNLMWDDIHGGLGSGSSILGTSVACDSALNVYSLLHVAKFPGTFTGQPIYIINSDTILLDTITGIANILIKYDVNGNIIWTNKISADGIDHIHVNNSGNIIVTNSSLGTKEFDSNGIEVWSNSNYAGIRIKSDAENNTYILSSSALTKLDSTGSLIWSEPFGGLDLYCLVNGVCYIAALDSIMVIDSSGLNTNTILTDSSTNITVDPNGIIYFLKSNGFSAGSAKGVTLSKIVSNNIELLYDYPDLQGGDIHFSENNNYGNALLFTTQSSYSTIFCPKYYQGHLSIPYVLATKLDVSNSPSVGFPDLWYPNYGSILNGTWLRCQGDTIDVNYSVCNSTFNSGNTFILELSNSQGNFANPISLGSINAVTDGTFQVVIPPNVPSGTDYRVRIRTTNPIYVSEDNGYNLPIDNLTNILTFSGFNTTICRDSKFLTCNLTGVQYQWERNGIPVAGATSQTYSPNITGPGTFRVLVSNNNGCSRYSTNSYTLNVYPRPSVSIVNNGNAFVCVSDSVELEATSTTAILYQWKKYNATVSGSSNSNVFYAKKGGTYKVIVTDINGCTRVSNQIDITGTPSGKITVSGPLTFCQGDSVTLYATIGIGNTYQWKKFGNNIPGATSPFFTATTSGAYKCLITDINGCVTPTQTKTATVNICPGREARIQNQPKYDVYPNPASSEFTVHFSEIDIPFAVELLEISGKLVERKSTLGKSDLEFNTSQLRTGIYIVRLYYNTGEILNRKLNIVH